MVALEIHYKSESPSAAAGCASQQSRRVSSNVVYFLVAHHWAEGPDHRTSENRNSCCHRTLADTIGLFAREKERKKKERERERAREWWRREKSPMLSAQNPMSGSSADVIEHDSEGLTWYDIMKYDSESLSSGKQKGHISRLITFFSIKHKLICWTF